MGILMRAFILTAFCASISFAGYRDNDYDNDADAGGSSFSSFNNFEGSSGTSIFNMNGNSIIITQRVRASGESGDFISVAIPKIVIDGDYFSCSTLTCSADAFKCVVTSEAIAEDLRRMKTTAECLDDKGKVIDSKEYEEKNPSPNTKPPFSRHSTADRTGVINIEDSTGYHFNNKAHEKMTKEQSEALAKNLHENTRRMNKQMQQAQENLQKQMQTMQENLKKTFGPGFPFGNSYSYANHFPYGNHFPFGNNFPFNYYNPLNYNYNYDYQPQSRNYNDDENSF